jgi:hypothetical protein
MTYGLVRVGDKVAMLSGCTVPVLLRGDRTTTLDLRLSVMPLPAMSRWERGLRVVLRC